MATTSDSRRAGILWGLTAFGLWGVLVFYFKAVGHVAPLEILAHRILWSFVLLLVLIRFGGVSRTDWKVVRERRVIGMLAASTVLIAANWFAFIWAVTTDRVLQASLGYYINPLVNVALGMIFLGERLTPRKWAAVALATSAVMVLVVAQGRLPVVALVLAFSFGFYGLIRKTVAVGPFVGLAVETGFLTPIAAGWLARSGSAGELSFLHVDRGTDTLLVLSGVFTTVPLLCFAAGARRIDYATMGLIQYVAPTLQFLIAVTVYGEPLRPPQVVAFALIWTGLVLYARDPGATLKR